jgi:hypothetical protein
MVAGYSRRLFLIGIVRSIQQKASPEERMHCQSGAVASSNHRIGGCKPHFQGISVMAAWVTRPALSQSLEAGLCIRYERGIRDPYSQSLLLSIPDHYRLCDIKTGTTLHQPHLILYIGGDDIASAGVSIPAVSCIEDDSLVAERVENIELQGHPPQKLCVRSGWGIRTQRHPVR